MGVHRDAEVRRREAALILSRLREAVPSVLSHYPVDAAYVYGSVARGTVMPFSDVDIALVLRESPPAYDRLRLELKIQAAIEDATGLMSIDVWSVNEAPLMVRGTVVQEGLLVYEGDRARRVDFEVQTRKRYFDFAPGARRLSAAFLDNIRREGLLRA